VPNLFGVIGGKANAISPGKKPLSSMTPVIVTQGGQLFLVAGSPGGSTIPTSVFQTLLQVTLFGRDVQTAVTAKRFHHQWQPDKIQIEKGAFSPETEFALQLKGHVVTEREPIGDVLAILRRPDGSLVCGVDTRRDAYGSVWRDE
jgi:gamma-glutamyltranspeptidase/glutathione hydrolase